MVQALVIYCINNSNTLLTNLPTHVSLSSPGNNSPTISGTHHLPTLKFQHFSMVYMTSLKFFINWVLLALPKTPCSEKIEEAYLLSCAIFFHLLSPSLIFLKTTSDTQVEFSFVANTGLNICWLCFVNKSALFNFSYSLVICFSPNF